MGWPATLRVAVIGYRVTAPRLSLLLSSRLQLSHQGPFDFGTYCFLSCATWMVQDVASQQEECEHVVTVAVTLTVSSHFLDATIESKRVPRT